MASVETPLSRAAAPPPGMRTQAATPREVVLRFLLFVLALVAIVVIVIAKQTVQGLPAAVFNNAPAFIMASVETPLSRAAAPSPGMRTQAATPREVVLRFLLFVLALVAIVVIVTAKQTVQGLPAAVFNNAPAFIYFVVAISVAGLYGVVTALLSFRALLKPARSSKLLPHFVIFDVILLGIVAAAVGSACAIALTGLKGNSHLHWGKICNVYGKFCRRIVISIVIAVFDSVVIVLLIVLSFSSLSKKIPKY